MEISIIQYSILLIIPYILVIIAHILSYKGMAKWIVRKFVHIIGLFAAALYGVILDELIEFFFVLGLLSFTVILLSLPPVNLMQRMIDMGTREGEREWVLFVNAMLTTLGVIILRVIFQEQRWIFLAAVLSVSLGDGMGEFVGRPLGIHKYKIFGQKSIEGSIGVFFGSLFGGLFSLLYFNMFSYSILYIIVLASLVVTLVEAVSFVFMDNLAMQFVYAYILWLLF